MSTSVEYDVVIVGAGSAGLYTAHLLHARGLRVKVLESQGLVGGRTYHRTGLFPWPVDLGGEFVHGQSTHFKALCDSLGVATVRTFASFPPTPYFTDGRPVAEYVWLGRESRLMSWVEAQQKDKDFAHFLSVVDLLDESNKDVRSKENLYQFFVRHGVAQRVLGLADAVYAKTWAADLSDLSVRGCIHEGGKPETGHDNYILENSTADLVKALSKGLDIELNQEVSSVTTVQGKRVVVKTKQGKSFQATRAVIGVPVTSIPSIQFSPALPRNFEDALAGAGVGVSVKAIIKFKRAFWPSNVLLCFCADSPVPQLWMDPPRPNYPGEHGHAVTCFATGTPAVAMANLPAWKQLRVCLNQLDAMFGTKADPHPASDSYDDHSICKWDTIAYTYPTEIAPEVLCGPVFSNTVFFCGEHCGTNMSEIATINGALESARHAASGVLASLQKAKL